MKKLSLFLADWIIFFKEIKEKLCHFALSTSSLINFKKLIPKMLNLCPRLLIYWIIYSAACTVHFLLKRSWINNRVVTTVCLLKTNTYSIYRYWYVIVLKKKTIYLLYKYFFKFWHRLACNNNLKLKPYATLRELFVNTVPANF